MFSFKDLSMQSHLEWDQLEALTSAAPDLNSALMKDMMAVLIRLSSFAQANGLHRSKISLWKRLLSPSRPVARSQASKTLRWPSGIKQRPLRSSKAKT